MGHLIKVLTPVSTLVLTPVIKSGGKNGVIYGVVFLSSDPLPVADIVWPIFCGPYGRGRYGLWSISSVPCLNKVYC